MPPRISPSRLPHPHRCQCLCTRPRWAPDTRQLHSSARFAATDFTGPRTTRLRRDFYAWLDGPGKAFRDPLPGSTNYMGAYDKQGNLLRTKRQNSSQQVVDQDEELSEQEIDRRETTEGLDDAERDERAMQRDSRRAEREGRDGIPRERLNDLRPYPLNHSFRSQPVLSEELREEIYTQLVLNKKDIESVSASFGVDVRRAAAVGRLKTIEKQWEAEGKRLAKSYADAVLAMLPQTRFRPGTTTPAEAHESINDLPVHPYTRTQLFYPTSESRQFTREDAAKAFDEKLLPADKRIPLPVLVQLEKWRLEGLSREQRAEKMRERDMAERQQLADKERKRLELEERTIKVVPGRRWDFKFQDISAELGIKRDGRTTKKAVGLRYGMAHEDRKRGMVKIPTSVE